VWYGDDWLGDDWTSWLDIWWWLHVLLCYSLIYALKYLCICIVYSSYFSWFCGSDIDQRWLCIVFYFFWFFFDFFRYLRHYSKKVSLPSLIWDECRSIPSSKKICVFLVMKTCFGLASKLDDLFCIDVVLFKFSASDNLLPNGSRATTHAWLLAVGKGREYKVQKISTRRAIIPGKTSFCCQSRPYRATAKNFVVFN
jgi:hypothetical protein